MNRELIPSLCGMMKSQIVKGGNSMKNRAGWFAMCVLLLTGIFAGSLSGQNSKITVMNPRGIKPPIRRIPMASRPKTLDGKTIYVVDTRYPRTREFVEELFRVLKETYPKTNWVFKDKYGGYMDDDPALWAEIKAKGHGMIMAVGHWSTCSPAVVGHCVTVEGLGVPTVPIVTQRFQKLVKAMAFKKGIPNLRMVYTPHPVTDRSSGLSRKYLEGVEPFASYLKLGESDVVPVSRFTGEAVMGVPVNPSVNFPRSPTPIEIIVMGGKTNTYWSGGDFSYTSGESIDRWR
jgi:hypothetical protein